AARRVAAVHARAAADAAQAIPQLRVDECVDDDGGMAAGAAHGSVEVVDRLRPAVAHLLELLFRKLCLERQNEARRGFPGGVGDDVELHWLRHRPEASGWDAPCLQAPLQKGLTHF